MKKLALILLLVSLLIIGCSKDTKSNIKIHEPAKIEINSISVEEVKNIIDNPSDYTDVTIIDVRSISEYEDGHIERAINLPLDIIENIDVSKDNKIVVYCHSGRRSSQAATKLIGLGYKNVFDMGGIIDWPYETVK